MSLEVFNQRESHQQMILPLWGATKGQRQKTFIILIACDVHSNRGQRATVPEYIGEALEGIRIWVTD